MRKTSKNKLWKSIFSPLKEVFFIVISILIAFNINQWNEHRETKKAFDTFLKSINTDLKTDTVVLKFAARELKKLANEQKQILLDENTDTLSTDDLSNAVIGRRLSSKLNDGTFLRTKNTKIFELDEYSQLFKRLNLYYITHAENLAFMNNMANQMTNESLMFWMGQENFEVTSLDEIPINQPEEVRRKSFHEILNSTKARNYLGNTYSYFKWAGEFYDQLAEQTESLIELTDSLMDERGIK